MKAKDKAKELVDRFKFIEPPYDVPEVWNAKKKQCALIAVDEIMKERSDKHFSYYDDAINQKIRLKYWQEIKQEILK